MSTATGLSEFQLKQLEKGLIRTPGPFYLLKLSDILNYPFAELMLQAGCIDTYTDPVKVRAVFEELALKPEAWIHNKSVDDMCANDVLKMKEFHEKLYEQVITNRINE